VQSFPMLVSSDGRGMSKILTLVAWILALLACALPPMISGVLPPSTNVIQQVTALAAWAGLAALLYTAFGRCSVSVAAGRPVLLAIVLVAVGVAWSVWWTELPLSLALMTLGALLAGAVLFVAGMAARQRGYVRPLLTLLATGWLVLGVLMASVCFIQVLAPQLADGDWIARTSLPGRAIGNMRQPNHTAVLLCWSCLSALWLLEASHLSKRWAELLLAIFVSAIVLTASRTGMVGILILAAWGGWDKKLSAPTRRLLLCGPLLLAASWLLTQVWVGWMHQELGATQRLAEGAGSPSRMAIWSDALALLVRYPWLGVGWGEFSLAWTLADFPRRSPVAFDHVHNLPLHLLVELGLPLGLAVLTALCWGLKKAWLSVRDAPAHEAVGLRFAAMILTLVGLHSLLEFPLWYMYFLLPAALLLGLCMGQPADVVPPRRFSLVPMRTMVYASTWVVVSGAAMFVDYLRVAALYEPDQLPMPEQMERAQQAWLFGTWADYMYATSVRGTKQGLIAAKRTAHLVVDTRLLMAWAESLHASGETDRAVFLAQRVREFRDPLADPWFAACQADEPKRPELPFQCAMPRKSFGYEDFL